MVPMWRSSRSFIDERLHTEDKHADESVAPKIERNDAICWECICSAIGSPASSASKREHAAKLVALVLQESVDTTVLNCISNLGGLLAEALVEGTVYAQHDSEALDAVYQAARALVTGVDVLATRTDTFSPASFKFLRLFLHVLSHRIQSGIVSHVRAAGNLLVLLQHIVSPFEKQFGISGVWVVLSEYQPVIDVLVGCIGFLRTTNVTSLDDVDHFLTFVEIYAKHVVPMHIAHHSCCSTDQEQKITGVRTFLCLAWDILFNILDSIQKDGIRFRFLQLLGVLLSTGYVTDHANQIVDDQYRTLVRTIRASILSRTWAAAGIDVAYIVCKTMPRTNDAAYVEVPESLFDFIRNLPDDKTTNLDSLTKAFALMRELFEGSRKGVPAFRYGLRDICKAIYTFSPHDPMFWRDSSFLLEVVCVQYQMMDCCTRIPLMWALESIIRRLPSLADADHSLDIFFSCIRAFGAIIDDGNAFEDEDFISAFGAAFQEMYDAIDFLKGGDDATLYDALFHVLECTARILHSIKKRRGASNMRGEAAEFNALTLIMNQIDIVIPTLFQEATLLLKSEPPPSLCQAIVAAVKILGDLLTTSYTEDDHYQTTLSTTLLKIRSMSVCFRFLTYMKEEGDRRAVWNLIAIVISRQNGVSLSVSAFLDLVEDIPIDMHDAIDSLSMSILHALPERRRELVKVAITECVRQLYMNCDYVVNKKNLQVGMRNFVLCSSTSIHRNSRLFSNVLFLISASAESNASGIDYGWLFDSCRPIAFAHVLPGSLEAKLVFAEQLNVPAASNNLVLSWVTRCASWPRTRNEIMNLAFGSSAFEGSSPHSLCFPFEFLASMFNYHGEHALFALSTCLHSAVFASSAETIQWESVVNFAQLMAAWVEGRRATGLALDDDVLSFLLATIGECLPAIVKKMDWEFLMEHPLHVKSVRSMHFIDLCLHILNVSIMKGLGLTEYGDACQSLASLCPSTESIDNLDRNILDVLGTNIEAIAPRLPVILRRVRQMAKSGRSGDYDDPRVRVVQEMHCSSTTFCNLLCCFEKVKPNSLPMCLTHISSHISILKRSSALTVLQLCRGSWKKSYRQTLEASLAWLHMSEYLWRDGTSDDAAADSIDRIVLLCASGLIDRFANQHIVREPKIVALCFGLISLILGRSQQLDRSKLSVKFTALLSCSCFSKELLVAENAMRASSHVIKAGAQIPHGRKSLLIEWSWGICLVRLLLKQQSVGGGRRILNLSSEDKLASPFLLVTTSLLWNNSRDIKSLMKKGLDGEMRSALTTLTSQSSVQSSSSSMKWSSSSHGLEEGCSLPELLKRLGVVGTDRMEEDASGLPPKKKRARRQMVVEKKKDHQNSNNNSSVPLSPLTYIIEMLLSKPLAGNWGGRSG